MSRVRQGVLLVLALGSCTAVAACGSSDSKSGSGGGGGGTEKKTVYINSYSQEIPFFANKHAGFEATGKKLGWTVDSEFGNNTPEQQISQIQNELTKKPDAMVLTPVDAQALNPIVRQVKEAGIPIIMAGADVTDPSFKETLMGQDNKALGKQKAEFVVKQLKGKGTVGIVHGIKGLDYSRDQNIAYQQVLKAAPGIKVVDGGYAGGFTSDLGLDRTQNLLTRNPGLDAIIYDNDDLALGGIQAAKERKISPDKILIVGTDGGDAALKAVRAGTLDFTVSLCGYALGAQAIDVLKKQFADDTPPPKRVLSKTLAITPDTIKTLQVGRPNCG